MALSEKNSFGKWFYWVSVPDIHFHEASIMRTPDLERPVEYLWLCPSWVMVLLLGALWVKQTFFQGTPL